MAHDCRGRTELRKLWKLDCEAYKSSQQTPERVEAIFGWMRAAGRVQAVSLCGVVADGTVWGNAGDGVQPGEDVEVASSPGGLQRCRTSASVPWSSGACQTPVGVPTAVTQTVHGANTTGTNHLMRPVIPLRHPETCSSAACKNPGP